MKILFRFALVGALGGMLSACPSSSNPDGSSGNDSGTTQDVVVPQDVVVLQDVSTDTGPDVPPLPPSLFNPCVQDSDCPTGGTCLLNTQGYPGGYCSQVCTRDTDCSAAPTYISPVCRAIAGSTQHMCQRECLNGLDCGRDGYTCIRVNDSDNTGLCEPSCSSTDCSTGAQCNAWTGLCEPTSAANPPPGVDDGVACTSSGTTSECRSQQCLLPTDQSTPTGWNGGTCVGNCTLPVGWNDTSLYDGPSGNSFPQGNCPAAAICFPNGSHSADGDPGICLHACMADSDCRASEGYFCHRTFALTRLNPNETTYTVNHTFDNGVCEPIDCVNDTTHTCPTGYTCDALAESDGQGGTYMVGVCVVGSTASDAGADTGPAVDASAGPDVVTGADAGGDTTSDTVSSGDQ